MSDKETIDTLVEGGKAAPGPALAPRLSMMKVNIQEVFKKINEKTKDYSGMKVPVKIIIDKKTKEIEIAVGTPPVTSILKKELGVELAKITEEEKTAGKTSVGNLTMEQVVKVAKMKQDNLLAADFKNAVKTIIGTCASMPVTIEGKKPKEVLKEIDEGKYDTILK
ncbi:MAG: 50S ribosomal protein L11 [Candidatus Aenigmatarchaeota archaeon]